MASTWNAASFSKIPRQLRGIVPRREDCTEKRVREAMKFLTDEWLCDVATDYAGKCTIIAAALTIIERSLLDRVRRSLSLPAGAAAARPRC